MSRIDGRRLGRSRLVWTALGGIWFGGVAFQTVGGAGVLAGSEQLVVFNAAIVAAVMLSTPIPWFLAVELHRGSDRLFLWGGVAGAAVGVMVHPTLWVVILVAGMRSPPDATFLTAVTAGSLWLSIFGLLIAGWITIPAGVLTGVSLGFIRQLAVERFDD